MGAELDKILIYGSVVLLLFVVLWIYIRKQKKESKEVDEKIKVAKEEGLFEPVSLHPVVDVNSCIKSGACILACPEHDILGIRNGKATVINASRCVGHGACFHACPTQAISLFMGTEKRGVELPHINRNFETNVSGIFIAGEMGGMGLIKNAVEQGKQAVENLAKGISTKHIHDYDLIIVGAGPAGISASLQAHKMGMKATTLEQDTLGGTVYTFPRQKIVMTSPMNLPLHGKAKLHETSKKELLDLWTEVLDKNKIEIRERNKVEEITKENGGFIVKTKAGEKLSTQKILLAIGRRGTPRKLGIPGEDTQKVAYRLLEPELIQNKQILIVGGGDSAVEAAFLLMDKNEVTLSYRKDTFSRLKPKNNEKIKEIISKNKISAVLNSQLLTIEDRSITLKLNGTDDDVKLANDQVYIFAGGELPTEFLKKAGIKISTKFGEAILTHKKQT